MGGPLILRGRHFRFILLYLCVCIYFLQHCSLFDIHVALELMVMEHSLPPLLLCRCGSACHPGPYSGAKVGQKVKIWEAPDGKRYCTYKEAIEAGYVP